MSNNGLRLFIVTGGALLGWSAANMAAAQTTAPAAPAAELDEVIVTAQRRSERLQDVPLAITVETPKQLEAAGVTNMRDLTVLVPGLISSGVGANIAPTIRGVNSQQTDPGNDSNVAIYVDGVYQASQIGNAMDFPDISRIEVLKGPQGTLFGRNAAGGAIRVFTREPDLSEVTGLVDVGFGNYQDEIAKGFLSVPLIQDKLAASISGSFENSDGWDHDIVAGTTSPGVQGRSVRVKLLGKPIDALSLEVFGSYAFKSDGNAVAYVPLNGNTVARNVPGAVFGGGPYQYALNQAPTSDSTVYTAGFRAVYSADFGDFSSLSTYNQTAAFYYTDGDGSNSNIVAYPISDNLRELSQELVFTSKKLGDFQFTVGANYYKDNARYNPLISEGSAYGGLILYGYMEQDTRAYAGFGQLTYTPTDRITLDVGARESDERRVASGNYYLAAAHPADLPPIGEVSYRSFTPRISVRYRLSEADDNIYYTYSQGFKSGGFDISALQTTPFKPEKLISNEVGFKSSPSRMLSANVAVFHYSYEDQQVMTIVDGSNITSNAASSHIYGADADIIARVTNDFTVTAGVSALSAKYASFPGAVIVTPVLLPDGAPCRCGNTTETGVNLTGTPVPFSPKFTYSISPDYKLQLAPGLLDMSAYLYSSGTYNYDQRVQQDAYITLAVRASFQPAGSKWNYYVWGKNLTDRKYFYTTFISNFGDMVTWAQPLSFGAGVRYAF
jgi:iron complex outermembrane receptor protein